MVLHRTATVEGCGIRAVDGEIGTVEDLYFDDERWVMRYLVVATGGWLSGREVLISPHAVLSVEPEARIIDVDLTREKVRGSPDIDTDRPVSRQQERRYHDYYGYPAYWPYTTYWAWGAMPVIVPPEPRGPEAMADHELDVERDHESGAHTHLRSCREVRGYRIRATDDNVGHVEDFVFDDETWAIRLLVVDTRNWLPGRHVLIAPEAIRGVSWEQRSVDVVLSREEIERAPALDLENLESLDDRRIASGYLALGRRV
jgi:uncharacterized protein YrrD